MHTVQYLTAYTFEELQAELARVRKGGMPPSTLYNWLRRLNITPDIDGAYTEQDLTTLKDLSKFLVKCPSIDKFIKVYFSN